MPPRGGPVTGFRAGAWCIYQASDKRKGTTMKCIFRRTRGGAWAIFGPADVVKPGATVTVEKKDGSTVDVEIARVGKLFEADGVPCVYGYRVAKKKDGAPAKGKGRRRNKRAAKAAEDNAALRDQVAELKALVAHLTGEAGAALAEAVGPTAEPAES